MTLHPKDPWNIPSETAKIAHASFFKGNIYMKMYEELGILILRLFLWKTRLKRRKKEEGRRKKEEVWNWDGDLDPNPILTPYDGGELNPYISVKSANPK